MIKYLCSLKVSLPGMEAIDKGSWYKLCRGAINCTISLCLNWPLTSQSYFLMMLGIHTCLLVSTVLNGRNRILENPKILNELPNLFSNYCRRFPSIYNNKENYCHLEKLSNILEIQTNNISHSKQFCSVRIIYVTFRR